MVYELKNSQISSSHVLLKVVVQCGLVGGWQRLGGTYRLRVRFGCHGDKYEDGATFQKTVISISHLHLNMIDRRNCSLQRELNPCHPACTDPDIPTH
jgi:hypothetical protein